MKIQLTGLEKSIHNLTYEPGIARLNFLMEYLSGAITSEEEIRPPHNYLQPQLTLRKIEFYNFISRKISEDARKAPDALTFLLSEYVQKLTEIRKAAITRLFVLHKTNEGINLNPDPFPYPHVFSAFVAEFNTTEIWDAENKLIINLEEYHIDYPLNLVYKLKLRNTKAEKAVEYLLRKGIILET